MEQSQRHILVTTDLSEQSFVAFGPAIQLARDTGSKLTVLHALLEMDAHPTGSPFVSPVKIPTTEQQIELARRDLEKLRSKFPTDLDLTLDATAGPTVSEAITTYARDHGVDIIAISTHGRGGLRRLVLGSIAEQVLRDSEIPVLMVPARKN